MLVTTDNGNNVVHDTKNVTPPNLTDRVLMFAYIGCQIFAYIGCQCVVKKT
jgi:hypothetical protein